ncbi:hypothetical protein IL54_2538 [Sphingobium sp. ba1]|nr:hypothetical protein IL54_2538 [Sphingobium sp. ba1]
MVTFRNVLTVNDMMPLSAESRLLKMVGV